MKEFKGLSGNWKRGKPYDAIVTDIPNGCDDEVTDYYGGAVVCESIPDEYTRSLLIASKDLLKACIPIHDLNGGVSKRFSYVFSVTIIYRHNGERLTETFKGLTRKDAEREVFEFVNGLK